MVSAFHHLLVSKPQRHDKAGDKAGVPLCIAEGKATSKLLR